jgi:general stress protein 26
MENKVENVSGIEASKKIKQLTDDARSCMMLTSLNERPIPVRPMGIQKVDDEGRLYFFTDKRTEKHAELMKSGEMQITVSNDKNSEYLNLYGNAEIYRDQKEIDEMYSAFANTWFEGKEDPNLEIIRFTPETGHYWDSKAGKLIQMAGFLIGAITGKQTDNGRQGDINA